MLDSNRSGPENMAIDEVVGETMVGRVGEVILRFYGWDPPTLSIGYNQPFSDLDLESLKNDGLGWVRRMTGGGGVLHWNELTYCIAIPYDRRNGFNRQELFAFCAGLLSGCYRTLGIETEPKTPGNYAPIADCFASPGAFELVETITGKKIAGSASTIKRGYFLQHGSLPLDETHRRIEKYLVVNNYPETDFEGSVSMDRFISPDRKNVLNNFYGYLTEAFDVTQYELSQDELSYAAKIVKARYTSDDWRYRR